MSRKLLKGYTLLSVRIHQAPLEPVKDADSA